MNKDRIKKVLYDIFIKYQGLFFLIVILDQVTKLIAIKYLQEPVKIFSWLYLTLEVNSGMAFSMGDDAPAWIGALISIAATIAIEYYLIFKAKKNEKVFNIILLCLAAGALGNGIDRLLATFGRQISVNGKLEAGVVDFIWPTFFANFNVADIFVTLSCIALLIFTFFAKDEKDNKYIKKKSEYEKEQLQKNQAINENEVKSNE